MKYLFKNFDLNNYDIADYSLAILATCFQITLLENWERFDYFSIQWIFISIMLFYLISEDKKMPLWVLCNGIVAPFLILYLEFKLAMKIYHTILHKIYLKKSFYRDFYDIDDSYKRNEPPTIKIKEEPKQIGYSFKEYLTKNDKEYQTLKSAYDNLLNENSALKSKIK